MEPPNGWRREPEAVKGHRKRASPGERVRRLERQRNGVTPDVRQVEDLPYGAPKNSELNSGKIIIYRRYRNIRLRILRG